MIFKGINRVTSGFRLPDRPTHNGIDLVGDDDPKVYAAVPGRVAFAGRVNDKASGGHTWEWGNYVRIDDANGRRYYYCHLANGSIAVKTGQKVAAGTLLGVMGNTGYSFGAHLHFEVRSAAGKVLDPASFAGVRNQKGIYRA